MTGLRNVRLIVIFLVSFSRLNQHFAQCQDDGIEDHDAEIRLKKDLLRDYRKDVFPPHTTTTPIVVRFGTSIVSVTDLDARLQSLTSEFWLKMMWNDSRLAWKPENYNNLQKIQFEIQEVWKPHVILLNSAKYSELYNKDTTIVTIHSTGNVHWGPPATLYTHCEVNLKYYPYDEHECYYKFGSWAHDNSHIDVDLEPNISEEEALFRGRNTGGEWAMVKTRAFKTTNVFPCCEGAFPDVTFYLTLRRRSPFYAVAIEYPLIGITLLILTSFWISPVSFERIVLNLVAFIALVLILSTLTLRLPAVGDNVPIIMIVCDILLLLSAFNTVITVCYITIIKTKKHKPIPSWSNTLLKTWVGKVLIISPPPSFERFNNHDDPEVLENENDGKQLHIPTSPSHFQWISFFQFIDRIAFFIWLVITVSVMTAT